MHSWVGYELVKVLLTFGLSPKIWDDLESWSPDLCDLFSYLGDKQRDPSNKERAEELLTILLIKLYITGILGNYHLEARTNLQK
jgi:hypothetical protein